MPNRIEASEDELFPVRAFFNAIPDDLFWEVAKKLRKAVGYSFNDCHCQFPADLDPDEESFGGVRFSLFETVTILNTRDFEREFREVCERQVVRRPAEVEIFKSLFGHS